MSAKEIRYAFSEGWAVESVEPSWYEIGTDPKYEIGTDPKDISFSDGGPEAYFVVVRRVAE